MIILSSAEQLELHRLVTDGAWSDAEAAQLPALSQMLDEGILQRIHTAIGWLTVLTPAGLKLLGIPQRRWHSIGSRLNDAYVRLSLEALQWPLISDSPMLELDTSERMVAAIGLAPKVGRFRVETRLWSRVQQRGSMLIQGTG